MTNKFDIRTIERKIKTGQITEEEYKQFLASLPDESENAENMDTQFVYAASRKEAANKGK
jgi:hypothetical protein